MRSCLFSCAHGMNKNGKHIAPAHTLWITDIVIFSAKYKIMMPFVP
jgi:hypothetical protein